MSTAQAGFLKKVMNLVFEALAFPDRNGSAAACEMNGKTNPHGHEIRQGARILKYIDGRWEERIDYFVTLGP